MSGIEESTATETPVESAATENPAEVVEGSVEGSDGSIENADWTPDYNFRTRDEQKEFDDWAKGLVKDKETEKHFRDLFERAHGLDVVKGDRDSLREHNTQLMEAADEGGQLKSELTEIGGLLRSGNIMGVESAFERLNIPDEVIFNYALHKLKLKEADPSVVQAYNEQKNRQLQMTEMQQQNEYWESQFSKMQVNQRTSDLNQTLSNPEISQTVEVFDQRAGYKGAFKDAVIEAGQLHFYKYKQDLPVEKAVEQVLRFAGPATTPQNYNRNAGVNVVSPQNRKPVLPSSRGSGSSPIRKIPKSIAELRQMANSVE